MKSKGTVAVGMSGGVDSSVAAALLKKQGYDVIGVFFHFWGEKIDGNVRENICCSLESMQDARRVAQKLNIKFYTINLEVDFKKEIVDKFISEYQSGHTPNPCVDCNRYIKFGQALDKVKALGVDYLATVHYARLEFEKDDKYHLYKGKDEAKDQTYFLHRLTQGQLKHVMFPLAKLKKSKVRKLAAKFGLPTASKRESQEVCFIPSGNMHQFLSRYFTFKTGPIKDLETKKTLGQHSGLQKYTIGQRKGIGLADGPWFVTRLDLASSTLWVTTNEDLLESESLILDSIEWIVDEPRLPINVKCKVRSAQKAFKAVITKNHLNKYIVQFKSPQKSITAGQYAVFWKGKECLGGGVIK